MAKWIGRAGIGLFLVGILILVGVMSVWWMPLVALGAAGLLIVLVEIAASD